jgi:ketosteroid isomerase-like protein
MAQFNNIIKAAKRPEEIADFFVEYINSGNIDGLVSLYEDSAVLVTNPEYVIASGSNEIREFYKKLLADNPKFEKGQQRPAIINGNIALTSTRLINGFVTAEVARKQPDGSWRWIIDQPIIAVEQTLKAFN